jgi:hypothetical protein
VAGEREETRYSPISVRMNGRAMTFTDARPMHINGVLYVPLADVARASNMRYMHRAGDDSFVLRTSQGSLRGTAGETRLSGRTGTDITLTDEPISIDGEIYVPTEFLTRAADMRVNWNRNTLQLDLESTDTGRRDNGRFDNRPNSGRFDN